MARSREKGIGALARLAIRNIPGNGLRLGHSGERVRLGLWRRLAGHLVVEVGDALLEVPDALAQGRADLGKPLGSEHHQDQRENDE
jgi:hypothetical protein